MSAPRDAESLLMPLEERHIPKLHTVEEVNQAIEITKQRISSREQSIASSIRDVKQLKAELNGLRQARCKCNNGLLKQPYVFWG